MKKYFLSIIFIFAVSFGFFQARDTRAISIAERVSGRILLQVEKNGEAWYVYPNNYRRYYLGRPDDAFAVMRLLSLGVSNKDFDSFRMSAPARLKGAILLKTEDKGKAYYVDPADLKMHYLGRPADAFRIMRELGLGISNNDLLAITQGNVENVSNEKPVEKPEIVFVSHNAPFTSQAPFGEWSDQRFQDGCEEASALMAVRWARGQSLTAEEAKKEIEKASDFQKAKYGEYRDASAKDVLARIVKDYFSYNKAYLMENISKAEIISELMKGRVVIAPMNGQKLGNPNFTPPGPVNHMLLIIGYDPAKDEFITNDPGTRKGAGYRYKSDVLYNALRNYPTGYHEKNLIDEKTVVVVERE
jgi:hypothetical protein